MSRIKAQAKRSRAPTQRRHHDDWCNHGDLRENVAVTPRHIEARGAGIAIKLSCVNNNVYRGTAAASTCYKQDCTISHHDGILMRRAEVWRRFVSACAQFLFGSKVLLCDFFFFFGLFSLFASDPERQPVRRVSSGFITSCSAHKTTVSQHLTRSTPPSDIRGETPTALCLSLPFLKVQTKYIQLLRCFVFWLLSSYHCRWEIIHVPGYY